jgi:outer membrane protein assembly factor BamB
VFIGSCNGVIHAIDKRTGQATWKYNALQDGGKQAEFHGIPVVTADLVVFGSDDRNPGGVGYVYAFEQKTGKLRWKYRAGRGWVNEKMTNVMAAPVVIGERLLFGGQDGVIRGLDAGSGRSIWKRDVGAPVTTPLVAVAVAVYFGTVNHRIHRLALAADEAHAELDLGGTPFGPPTLLGDSLVVLVYDNPDTATLKSVDLAVNGLRWSRETSGGWSSARAYLWRSRALAGSQRGKLAAFSPDGSEDWSDTIGGVIRGIGVGDDVLYVGTLRGTLYAYRPDRRLEGP